MPTEDPQFPQDHVAMREIGSTTGRKRRLGWFDTVLARASAALNGLTAIALMIPITYGLDPASGIILMAGVYYGSMFGGSTASILINTPGCSASTR